ncbi:MAG: hypothetical protein QOD41_4260 [Cryptosporangiaceae bacterium]|jgi:hypothetical protein|nr:hypothetical protein [Cryptosporangiaceae bacterium]
MRLVPCVTAVTVTAALALAGCSSSPGKPAGSAPGAAPAGRTAYERVLDQVGPDGTVTKDTALAAFAAAIAPLPGLPSPARSATANPSGTLAVQWILRFWPQLTAGQRDAVRAALASPGGSGGSGGPAAGGGGQAPSTTDPDIDCQRADSAGAGPYRAQLDAAVAAIAAHRGPLKLKTSVQVNNTNRWQPSTMYTFACRGGKVAADAGVAPDSCTIHLNPKAFTGYTDRDRASFLIHEAMHCFLDDRFGLRYPSAPAWLVEGIPTWVQGTLGGGDPKTAEHWTTYLAIDKKPLYARTYDAVGYLAHLAETGTDVWSRIDPMFTAAFAGGNAAAFAAARPGPAFLDSWPSSYARGRHPGPAWDTAGAGRPDYRADVPVFALPNGGHGSFATPAAGTYLVSLAVTSDVVEFGTAPGAHGFYGDAPLASVAGQAFCAHSGGCACPSGGPALPALPAATAYLALTGGQSPASLTVTGTSTADFCAKPRTSCVIGTWTSTGFDIAAGGPNGITEHGGSGVVLRIAASGASSVSFGPMSPVTFTSKSVAGSLRYDGTATGTVRPQEITAATGRWLPSGGNFGNVTATVAVTSPFKSTVFNHKPLSDLLALGKGLAGGVSGNPVFGPGTYTCSPSTLVIGPPTGGSVTGTWTLRRS